MGTKQRISEALLENSILKIKTAALGAELTSIIDKDDQEYLWQGKSTRWERQNPVLFPIIAIIENHQYNYDGQRYQP